MPAGGMTTTASIPPKVRRLIATVPTAFGGTALAVGLGVIPLPPEKLHAPLWIVSACGVSFAGRAFSVAEALRAAAELREQALPCRTLA
jgi:hypothetical protein